ncbi:MAG: hypothetical protein AB7V46_19905 [Thermomicrobiales bacterium]
MTGDRDPGARQALLEVSQQHSAIQGQREDAAADVAVPNHPFNWWDLLLVVMPVATIVFAMLWGTE